MEIHIKTVLCKVTLMTISRKTADYPLQHILNSRIVNSNEKDHVKGIRYQE